MKYCSALRCRKPIGRDKIYCKEHWFKLPKPARDGIWASHRSKDRSTHLINIARATLYLNEVDRESNDS